jgi:hypothetical protein
MYIADLLLNIRATMREAERTHEERSHHWLRKILLPPTLLEEVY